MVSESFKIQTGNSAQLLTLGTELSFLEIQTRNFGVSYPEGTLTQTDI